MPPVREAISPPLQMCHPGAHRFDDAHPAPLLGAIVESSPSVAHTGSADFGIAGKIPGNPQGPAQPAMFGNVVRLAKASRAPSAQPMGSTDITGTHVPPAQISLPPQRTPHAPQLFGSSPSRTHCVPHSVKPLAQTGRQTPPLQTCPDGHMTPHAPQWLLLLVMSTQAPAHVTVPSGQVQTPARQSAPAGQGLAQRPQ